MGLTEIFLVGIGLSMDAFAVSICKGLKMHKLNLMQTALISFFFGFFQALMPFLGWLIGTSFYRYVEKVDHWIAFFLLAVIGIKMIIEAFKNEEETDIGFDLKELFLLAIATSIDAFAVGITFAFLKIDIFISVLIIGITTFVFSATGVFIGHKFGEICKRKAEVAGGVILLLIGIKILLEGLGLIPSFTL